MGQRCGIVTVIGAPNAGKSTLVNSWVGSKVSIVSPKVQTTRCLVRGIALKGESQVVFVDTPGLFDPQKRLEKAMVSAAWQGTADADLIILVVDASRKKIDPNTASIVEKLARQDRPIPCVLVLNKVDQAPKENLLKFTASLNEQVSFDATFMVSALNNDGCDDVLAYAADKVPEGEWLFPEDQVSDMPMRLLAAEITREKLFLRLYQELPYSLTVETESWEDFDDGSIKINQVIYVARDTHKGIVLGKGGQQIKEIGEKSRMELEEILETKVHLKLFVKVQEGWSEDSEKYRIWGLDYSS